MSQGEGSLDAIVIGSGPGGSAAADVLTQAGWSVVIMEKGSNYLLDADNLAEPASHYSNDEIKFISRHFLGPDPLIEPRTFRACIEDGDHSFVGEVNSIPATLGGGGTHADGKVPRFREEDFRLFTELGPQAGADVADWPLTYDDLEPYYMEVERRVGVAGTAGANPFASWRSEPYPMPSGAPMYGALLSSAAAERHGLHPYPAPTAANSVVYAGRPACNNCGYCAFFGCPIHAKGDPIALLQRIVATGRAQIMTDTFVSRIIVKNGRATGVEFIDEFGESHTMQARHVILAAGAVETPRLLLLSGIDNPLVGRYLMVHFQTLVVGSFKERFHAYKGRSVTHVHDDAIIGDALSRSSAREAGLAWMRGGMVEHSGSGLAIMEAKSYPWGSRHATAMRESALRDKLWAFIMQGEDLAYKSNTIDLDPRVRDMHGLPVARMTYKAGKHELVASEYFGPRLEAVLKDMGAEWTFSATSPGAQFAHGRLGAVPESRHVMGTTRMGNDPTTSVVDSYGRVHGVENLVVADSSVFVTSAGYGPTLTLVALAARAASALAH